MRRLSLLLLLSPLTCFGLEPLTVPMLDMSNTIRASANRQPQPLDARLCNAAQDQADYMAAHHQPRPNRFFFNPTYSHDSNGGTESRLARHGFRWSKYGENLNLCLPGDPIDVWPSWCKSAPHYATILSPCELAGFGMATASDGATYWTAVYGTEDRSASMPADDSALAYEIVNAEASIGNYIPVQDAAVYLRVKRQLDGRTGREQAEPRQDAYQRVGDAQPQSLKGGHVQGPTQAPAAQQCGPGCGQAKAYYQPRRGVRAFGSCGGGRRFAVLPRNRR